MLNLHNSIYTVDNSGSSSTLTTNGATTAVARLLDELVPAEEMLHAFRHVIHNHEADVKLPVRGPRFGGPAFMRVLVGVR